MYSRISIQNNIILHTSYTAETGTLALEISLYVPNKSITFRKGPPVVNHNLYANIRVESVGFIYYCYYWIMCV